VEGNKKSEFGSFYSSRNGQGDFIFSPGIGDIDRGQVGNGSPGMEDWRVISLECYSLQERTLDSFPLSKVYVVYFNGADSRIESGPYFQSIEYRSITGIVERGINLPDCSLKLILGSNIEECLRKKPYQDNQDKKGGKDIQERKPSFGWIGRIVFLLIHSIFLPFFWPKVSKVNNGLCCFGCELKGFLFL